MVKDKNEGPKFLSAYPLADQPVGASVPYMPQARPWNARTVNPPTAGSVRDPSTRMATTFTGTEDDEKQKHPAEKKPTLAAMTRPTASVTDIPGASAPAIRIQQPASFKKASKPVRGGAMSRDLVVDTKGLKGRKEPVYHHSLPAMLYFALGCVVPIFNLCGCRYLSSANWTAKVFGYMALGTLAAQCTAGLILGAAFWRSDSWSREDPACIAYLYGQIDNLDGTDNWGSALAIQGLNGPGLATTSNISIFTVGCAFVSQVVVDESSDLSSPRTFYVRVVTPGTTGDNFGVYVRSRGKQIQSSTDQAPARSWFEFADPERSNPRDTNDLLFGSRPDCLIGMCDGVFGVSLPELKGSQWEARVPLNWYKYYMAMGVFALDKLALERPFCMDTCVVQKVYDSERDLWVDPCEDVEITQCMEHHNCVFAKTREDCLGQLITRRKVDRKLQPFAYRPPPRH